MEVIDMERLTALGAKKSPANYKSFFLWEILRTGRTEGGKKALMPIDVLGHVDCVEEVERISCQYNTETMHSAKVKIGPNKLIEPSYALIFMSG